MKTLVNASVVLGCGPLINNYTDASIHESPGNYIIELRYYKCSQKKNKTKI